MLKVFFSFLSLSLFSYIAIGTGCRTKFKILIIKESILSCACNTVLFIFGLLHGLGFAGVLNEIRISTNSFFLSLISFNVGVEFGQVCVIILSYILIALLFQKKYGNKIE
jgi:hypothetical protein